MMKETYLIIAYMAIWVGLSGYLAVLAQKQRQLALRLELLDKQRKED
jgi:CcmD family protein